MTSGNTSPSARGAGLDAAARLVGDRWSLRLIGALLDGERTFGELAGDVAGIAPTILAARLRSLQGAGLLTASPYELRPVRMRYALTAPGRRLAAAIATLAEWGAAREGTAQTVVHSRCGTPVVTRPWCPTCEEPVEETGRGSDELLWC
ncbi:winged helix-turn-helix transcriptional regulator [Propionicimonas sp.]|uniref:winged helix-turn-helix transcriptional regulator n=1 Tax=Propionicimonas sp. TaxID=1955623 RepID=UPI0039E5A1BA